MIFTIVLSGKKQTYMSPTFLYLSVLTIIERKLQYCETNTFVCHQVTHTHTHTHTPEVFLICFVK